MREKTVDPDPRDASEPNPWAEHLEGSDPLAELDAQFAGGHNIMSATERAAQYTEWAERMRAKRQRVREAMAQNGVTTTDSTYWTPEALYAESERVVDEELVTRPNPWRVQELLAVFDLRDDATPDEVGDAYRRLAKQHHPDRFAAADEETQRFHEGRMRDINLAYNTLKQLQRA